LVATVRRRSGEAVGKGEESAAAYSARRTREPWQQQKAAQAEF
jgi:hypothetical protein